MLASPITLLLREHQHRTQVEVVIVQTVLRAVAKKRKRKVLRNQSSITFSTDFPRL
jgi:hypothetical protein